MLRIAMPLLTFLSLAVFFCSAALASEATVASSLNVRDFGATGSEYETTASTVAGNRTITVADPRDFRPGQEVIVNGAYAESRGRLYGPGSPYDDSRPLRDEVEIRGNASAAGSWVIYLLEIDGANPLTLRWSDDLARSWQRTKVPVTFDWQPLSGGMEMRINKRDLVPGNMISFSARNQLATTIETFDPEALVFRLERPRQMKAGDQFEIAPPYGANWNLHDNTVTGCLNPVLLDAYGSSTSTFARNIISRGGATGVQQALQLRGRFNVIGNTFSDFDEPGSVVLGLYPDRFGKALPNIISGNIIEHCAHDLSESKEGLWRACRVSGNMFPESDGVGK
jgi:hypothetical protein